MNLKKKLGGVQIRSISFINYVFEHIILKLIFNEMSEFLCYDSFNKWIELESIKISRA